MFQKEIFTANRLLLVCLATLTFLQACKYDEGPFMSFASKRNRVSNAWIAESYEVDGQVKKSILDSFLIGDSLHIVLTISENGAYCVDYQYVNTMDDTRTFKGNRKAGSDRSLQLDLFKGIGHSGNWTFIDKHRSLQMSPHFLTESDVSNISPFHLQIIELRQKHLKLEFDVNGRKHTIRFKSLK